MSSNNKTLIITKDEQAFQQSNPLLLLGKWCIIDYPEESIVHDLEYVYNPLSDNEVREKHYYYIQKVVSRLIVKMAKVLNAHHKVTFPDKVWKMLLGSYALMFSHLAYIKWLLLQNAFKMNNTKVVRVPVFDYQDDFYPEDYKHFSKLLNNKNFYDYLTREIILKMDFNVTIEEFEKNYTREEYSSNIPSFKKRLYEKIIIAGKWIYKSGINPKILFFNSIFL